MGYAIGIEYTMSMGSTMDMRFTMGIGPTKGMGSFIGMGSIMAKKCNMPYKSQGSIDKNVPGSNGEGKKVNCRPVSSTPVKKTVYTFRGRFPLV